MREAHWKPVQEILTAAQEFKNFALAVVMESEEENVNELFQDLEGGSMTFFNTESHEISNAGSWTELWEEQGQPVPVKRLELISEQGDALGYHRLRLCEHHMMKTTLLWETQLALDFFGEHLPMFQLLFYDPISEDPQAAIRYQEGNIVEVMHDMAVDVDSPNDPEVSRWMKKRDGK
jgi:hypothetical protein